MKAVESVPARTSKPVVLLSVILTAALSFAGMFVYTRLFPSAVRCSCDQADASTRPVGGAARNESLALALASIASAKPGEPQSPVKQAETSRSENPPSQPPDEIPMSKEEVFARQKADAHTLDAQLLSEDVDPVWSAKIERATAEAMVRIGSTMHLDEVTCRETLCRAKVTHLDPQAHEQDMDRLLTMPVIAGQALAVAPANDDRNTVLYFSRKGTPLSVLQPPMDMTLPASIAPPDVLPSE